MHAAISALPISSYLPAILTSRANVLILSAETGSGKTIGFPYALAEQRKSALVLEPLIATCEGAAEYVASLFRESVGGSIGISAGDSRTPGKFVTYATTAVGLVRAVLDERRLALDCLVIDEFHERRADQDVVFAWALSRLSAGDAKFNQLVIASATLDVPAVERHVRSLGLTVETFTIPGRTFPVEYKTVRTVAEGIKNAIDADADVLVFHPGVSEIDACVRDIRTSHPMVRVFPYHSRLSSSERNAALTASQSGSSPVVIVSTNALETGRTVMPRSGRELHVVDSGMEKSEVVNCGVSGLALQPISIAQQKQRGGRTGRVSAGVCWQVESSSRRTTYAVPEIQRTILSRLFLSVSASGLDLASLPLFDAPDHSNLTAAHEYLLSVGAITEDGKITAHGRALMVWPVDPRWAQVLQRSIELGCLADAITCVALAEQGGVDGRETEGPAHGEDWLAYQMRIFTGNTGLGGAINRVRQTVQAIRRVLPRNVSVGAATGDLTLVRRAWASAHKDQYGVTGSSRRGATVGGYSIGRPFDGAFGPDVKVTFVLKTINAPKGAFTVAERVIRLDDSAANEIAPITSQTELVCEYGRCVNRTTSSWGKIRLGITDTDAAVSDMTAKMMCDLYDADDYRTSSLHEIESGMSQRAQTLIDLGCYSSGVTPYGSADDVALGVRGMIHSALSGTTSVSAVNLTALQSDVTARFVLPVVPALAVATDTESVTEWTPGDVTRFLVCLSEGTGYYTKNIVRAYDTRKLAEAAITEYFELNGLAPIVSAMCDEASAIGGDIYSTLYSWRYGRTTYTATDVRSMRARIDAYNAEKAAQQAAADAEKARLEAARMEAPRRLLAALREVIPGCPCCGAKWEGLGTATEIPVQFIHPPTPDNACCEYGTYSNQTNENDFSVPTGRRGRHEYPNMVVYMGDIAVAFLFYSRTGNGDYPSLQIISGDGWNEAPYMTATGAARVTRRSDYLEPKWVEVRFDRRNAEKTYGGGENVTLTGPMPGQKGYRVEYTQVQGESIQTNVTYLACYGFRVDRVQYISRLKPMETTAKPVVNTPAGKPASKADLSALLGKFQSNR